MAGLSALVKVVGSGLWPGLVIILALAWSLVILAGLAGLRA